jgi:hypothetical protein
MHIGSIPFAGLLATSLLACGSAKCDVPERWVRAISMNKPTVPYTPYPLAFAEETAPGRWNLNGRGWEISVQSAKVTEQDLLRRVANLHDRYPKPLFLFSFSASNECDSLNRLRQRIADAAKCSHESPCLEGVPDEL